MGPKNILVKRSLVRKKGGVQTKIRPPKKLCQKNLVKIAAVIAEILLIWTNVTGTYVAWTNVTLNVGIG